MFQNFKLLKILIGLIPENIEVLYFADYYLFANIAVSKFSYSQLIRYIFVVMKGRSVRNIYSIYRFIQNDNIQRI